MIPDQPCSKGVGQKNGMTVAREVACVVFQYLLLYWHQIGTSIAKVHPSPRHMLQQSALPPSALEVSIWKAPLPAVMLYLLIASYATVTVAESWLLARLAYAFVLMMTRWSISFQPAIRLMRPISTIAHQWTRNLLIGRSRRASLKQQARWSICSKLCRGIVG
jgi:hypothetical protein